MIPFTQVSAETPDTSKDIDTLVSELIYYYGEDARTDILRTLEDIEEKSSEDYEIWDSIINKWDFIEKEMHENLTVAPDGLSQDDTHAFIVLGFALNSDGTMTDELIGRLEVALNSANKYPNSYVLVTGGVEKNGWTEGDRMFEWLVENGLPEERIIVENKSANTVENASFSYNILYNDYNIETASLISSQYHLKRASIFYYTMSLLKAKELGVKPIEFIAEGNSGWYRADKTEETMRLKVNGMSSIAGVDRAAELPISQLESLLIESDLEYALNEELNLTVFAQYDSDYVRDVTQFAEISQFDSSEIGDKEIEINYTENDITLSESITVTVSDEKDNGEQDEEEEDEQHENEDQDGQDGQGDKENEDDKGDKDASGDHKSEQTDNEEKSIQSPEIGGELPKTATNNPLFILIGSLLVIVGSGLTFIRKKSLQ